MICVYQYGCKPPREGEAALVDQLRKANALWNRLVELDRAHIEAVRALTAEDPAVAALEAREAALVAELEALRTAIKARRQEARKRVEARDGEKERLAEVRDELRALRADLKAARKDARAAAKPALDELNAELKAAIKRARQAAAAGGLYWGTYNDVIARYMTAAQRARRTGAQLRFHRFTGTGTATVQMIGGMSVADLFGGTHGQLQVDPVDPRAWTSPIRGERRRHARTRARVRVTSDGRAPVWVDMRMVMHREIPHDGRIKLAQLTRRRVATDWEYSLAITVDLPEEPAPKRGPAAAVDIGWRVVPGGVRVATLVDEAGAVDHLVLPDDFRRRLDKVAELRSVQQKDFNAMLGAVSAWLSERKGRLPEWLDEETKTLYAWRSPGRLARLTRLWAERVDELDDDAAAMLQRLQAWARQDRHLWSWWAHQSDKLGRQRREVYRVWASRAAERYATLVIEAVDWRSFGREAPAEEDQGVTSGLRALMRLASPGELSSVLRQAAAARGGQVVLRDPSWSTQTCHVCGELDRFDAAATINHRCSKCGALWDQDENAARNLLRGYVEEASAAAAS